MFFVSTALVRPVLANENEPVNLTLSQQNAELKLKKHSKNLNVNWNNLTQTPNFIRVKNLDISRVSDDKIQRVYQFLDEYKDLFQINDARQELQFVEQTKDSLGMQRVTLQQMYQGVPVYASRLMFHFRPNGDIASIKGTYLPNLSNKISDVRLSKSDAINIANHDVQQQLELTDESFKRLNIQEASSELVYYNHGLFSKRDEKTYLTWRISVFSDKTGLNKLFYINANDGTIIHQLNNLFEAQSRETYVFSDCLDYTGTLTYDEAGLFGAYDEQAETVHGYAGVIYDYYNSIFGRDSYDGEGGLIKSYTHYEEWDSDLTIPGCAQVANAFWEPTRNIMKYGEDFLSLDVAGHETTHGVIQYSVGTTDDDTLEYENESGALNESYADIFGEMTEFYNGSGDWLLGTDLPNGPSRDFADPNMGAYDRTASYDASTNYGQPSHVSEQSQVTDPLCDSYDNDDYGCIHLNSGITNNALYLLVNGGTNPYSGDGVATGIGREAAEQIYYRALTTYLDVNSDFQDSYQATLQSCLDLNDSDSTTYPISYCEAVFDAFAVVGINTDTSYAYAAITVSATSGTTSTSFTFDGADSIAIGSTITDYAWDFDTTVDSDGDGTADNDLDASGGAVSHTFSTVGTYTVQLTVTDTAGNSSSATTTITIYASGTISTNTTWSADHSPYLISGAVTVASGSTLTIDPGVVVKFLNTSSSLTVSGTLDAIGTSTDAIIFTSYKDDTYGGDTNGDGTASTPAAGDWYYTRIYSGGVANLDYITMQYGGYTGTSSDYAMLLIDDNATSVTVDHSTLQNGQYDTVEIDPGSTSTIQNSTIANMASQRAIYITGGTSTITGNTISATSSYGVYVSNASPTVTGNTFTDSDYGLYISGSSSGPTITDNTFTGNYYPIFLGTLTSGTILTGNSGSSNTSNGIMLSGATSGDVTLNSNDNSLPYLAHIITVNSSDALTLAPGTLIKFVASSSAITSSGTFNAIGTSTEPIVLSSYRDDTYGGDTNGDGSTTTPAAGDWGYIRIVSGNFTGDYITMQYGGASTYAMFWVQGSTTTMTLNHSTLQHMQYYNVLIDTNATVTISNSTLTGHSSYDTIDIQSDTVTLDGNAISNGRYGVYSYNASPTLTNNTITDSTYGLVISGASSAPIITDNIITENTYGVFVSSSANPTLTNNQIYANTSYGLYSNSSTTTTVAESNWWGDTSGPYHATTNPSGTGDPVSDYVDFDPWLTIDPDTDVTPPADVTLGTMRKDVWNNTLTLNWTNPTDTDFDHVQIDRTDVTAGTTSTISTTETGTSYVDSAISYNTTYTYTLYSVDTTGNVSTGTTTTSQRVRNPAPSNLFLTTGDTTLTANWRASSASTITLAGYKVYYGTAPTALTSVIDVGNVTSATLTGLTNGTRYFVAVSAYSRAGIESDQSAIRSARPRL